MRKLVIMLVLAAGIAGGLWYQGVLVIPGFPSPGVPRPSESPAVSTFPTPTGTPAPTAAPTPVERNPQPTAKVPAKTEPPKATELTPRIGRDDLSRAEAAWKKGDLPGVKKALAKLDPAVARPSELEASALRVLRRAQLVEPLLARVVKSPLASGDLEQVDLASGGRLFGKVEDKGSDLKITAMGGIQTVVSQDDVQGRSKLARDRFHEKVRARLREKEEKQKEKSGISLFRLAYFCWSYGLAEDAVPYLERSVEDDQFPAIAQVFGGEKGAELAAAWHLYTGRAQAVQEISSNPGVVKTPGPGERTPPSLPAAGGSGPVGKARGLYDQAVTRYQVSFTDSREAEAAVKDARKLLGQALETLEQAGDAPGADRLRMQCSMLLADCRKHGGM